MNRIISIILTDLASDKLKYEEEMEKTINGSLEINERVDKIKHNLEKIVLTELMINTWKNYTNQSIQEDK
jgi:hypothetical protein